MPRLAAVREVWSNGTMTLYRERLWPAPWLFFAVALVIPASLLVFLPISDVAGVVVAAVLYASCVLLLLIASPAIVITESELTAGKARIPVALVGAASAHSGDDARQQRGPGLDARAWLLIRGWVDPVVRIPVDDPADPTPYWLISSRHPEKIASVLAEAKANTARTAGGALEV